MHLPPWMIGSFLITSKTNLVHNFLNVWKIYISNFINFVLIVIITIFLVFIGFFAIFFSEVLIFSITDDTNILLSIMAIIILFGTLVAFTFIFPFMFGMTVAQYEQSNLIELELPLETKKKDGDSQQFCKSCGKILIRKRKFCTSCGAPLE